MSKPRASIPHREVFPRAGGLVYSEGEPMPPDAGAILLDSETPDLYIADGKNNWVLKPTAPTKEKIDG
jgi:hypothetical protein